MTNQHMNRYIFLTLTGFTLTSFTFSAALLTAFTSIATFSANAIHAEKRQVPHTDKKYIGKFVVTAYCSCPICCGRWAKKRTKGVITASGKRAVAGTTVATSWNVLPKGTVIEINKLGRRVVHDKPAKWIERKYNGRIIDVYFDNHKEAKRFGRQLKDVWVLQTQKL